jgi:NAD(P)-dependent dehydrogenase (short-subunit alcohol dehydrogenase family)
MTDLLGLTDKTAIVWGGGRGMGERSALRLGEAGCNVAVVDIVPESAERISSQIRAAGRRSIPLVADVTSERQVEAAVAAAEAALGPIDVMITVVGMAAWAPLVDMTMAQWDATFDVCLKSFFIPARSVARALLRAGRPGSIVGISSISGLISAPGHGSYGAAKAGLVNLVRTMALEWGGAGIRVNTIAPGSIANPRYEATQERLALMAAKLPLRRAGTMDEIAKAALFLTSDLASYVTGTTLLVDGGWMTTYLLRPDVNKDAPVPAERP